MPFEVFRRHQKKLLTIFAILAMTAFVLSDSVPRYLNSTTGGRDQKVAELYGRAVYQSQINEMARQRSRANLFVASMAPFLSRDRDYFGGLKQRDIVDALILQHEADRLGMPVNAELGREWLGDLAKRLRGRMTDEMFNTHFSRFGNEVSEDQLLTDIANQARLLKVRFLLGSPVVTPYDVFQSYREENERVSAKLAEIAVESFLSQVAEPSPGEIEAFFDQYKNELPDPARETPGFKVPRQLQFEIMSLDGNALTRGIREKLTDADLRPYYENHKTEFEVPSELPKDLFADQPDLTPASIQSFADIRGLLAPRLAEEKAQSEIQDKFDKIKNSEMLPFVDKYLAALDQQEDTKKQGNPSKLAVPTPVDLKAVADREGLSYEKTGLLSREAAERYGQVSAAEAGLTPLSGGRKFADEMYDAKTGIYEPVELTDILGTRYLLRKIKDEPPHVPQLDEVRPEVVRAWKTTKARPLAEKAADDLAARLKAGKEALKEPKVQGHRVFTVPPITRTQTSLIPTSMYELPPVVETQIPDVPLAGDDFREVYFGLQAGTPAVAPNKPKSIYYVMTLDRREPATFAKLYAPFGDERRYRGLAFEQAVKQQSQHWMSLLRLQAGLKPDWIPPDEAKKEASESAKG
jgi:peptidyl-prolyl cis-trans isomerase D